MNQRQLVALGYAAIGVLLLFGEFLPDLDAIFTQSMSSITSLAILLGSVGCIISIVMGITTLRWPEGRLAIRKENPSQRHLYVIWGAATLVAIGVALSYVS